MATPTFLERCKHAFDTADVLRRLRANLAAEQKALAELDYLVYIKLLDPVQLSKCILAAFPEHCDVVSLLNAIHSLADDAAETSVGGTGGTGGAAEAGVSHEVSWRGTADGGGSRGTGVAGGSSTRSGSRR